MARKILILILLSLSLWSCDRQDVLLDKDSAYPTVISKLSSAVLSQEKSSFLQANPYMKSGLNQFGFCALDENRNVASPPLLTPPTQAEAEAIVRNFVSKDSKYIGIKNPSDLTFTSVESSTGYWDGATYWYLRTPNQKIDTIEVLYTGIIFHVKNREMCYCSGNWFPYVYIPNKFNISKDMAKESLLNKVVSHYDIAGQRYDVKIQAPDLSASTVRLVVLPVTLEDKIELHVTWQIDIPAPVFYRIYVDVMTGKPVGDEPTIIS
jgi:hypothetical protein